MRKAADPGTFRKLMSDMGGRSFLLVSMFSVLVMGLATMLIYRAEFNPEHWLAALKWCATVIAALLGKRMVEEVGAAFGKNE